MKILRTITALLLIMTCAVVAPLPAALAAQKAEVIDKTAYVCVQTYLPSFGDEEYKYSYSVSDRECIRVTNEMSSGNVGLTVVGKKPTKSHAKPIITIYRKKNGEPKKAYRKYRITVKTPKVTRNISVNKGAYEYAGLKYDNDFTKEVLFKYSDKSIAQMQFSYGNHGFGNNIYDTYYLNGIDGWCVKGLKYGTTRIKAYLKGTKVVVGDFKVTVKDIKPSIKNKYKTITLYYSTYGLVKKQSVCADCLVNYLCPKSKISVKFSDNKIAKAYRGENEYGSRSYTVISAKKLGKTKAALYETLGGKKRKVGTVRLVVKKAKMADVARYSTYWDEEGIDIPDYLYPGESFSAKRSIAGYWLYRFKKSDYKITVKSTEPGVLSVDENGVVKALKPNKNQYTRIKYTIVFKDGSKLSGSFGIYIESRGANDKGEFIYSKKDGKTAKIKRYIGTETKVVIPETVDGLTVTELGERFLPPDVDEVIVPSTVTKINPGAFDYTKVNSIIVSEDNGSFTSVDGVLFNKKKTTLLSFPPMRTLDSYEVPDGVKIIGKRAFYGCQVKSVKLPASVETIGNYAFASMDTGLIKDHDNDDDNDDGRYVWSRRSLLESVGWSEGLKSIGEYAFLNSPIKTAELPSALEEIGENAFDSSMLTSVSVPAGVRELEGAFHWCKKLRKVKLSEGLKEIGEDAFCGCKIKTIKIPNTVTTIEQGSFLCDVESLKLPDSLRDFSSYAFGEQDDSITLKRISISNKNKYFSTQNNVLYNKSKTKLIYYPARREKKTFTVPETVKTICEDAFIEAKLDSLTIPGSVKTIESDAFQMCRIGKLKIRNGVKAIESEAFDWCDIKGSLTIPGSVKKLSDHAFEMSTVDSFTIPKCMKKVRGYMLLDIRKELIIPPHVRSVEKYAFKMRAKAVVKGKKGTAAENFAAENKLKFVEI